MKTVLRCSLIAAIFAALVTPRIISANTAVWIGNPNITTTTNWSDNANWSNTGGGVPGAATNDLKFNGVGSTGAAGTITSVADTAQHPTSIQFSNNSQAAIPEFHTVLVPAGVTITNEGTFIVGGAAVNPYRTIVNFTGNGTLLQKATMTIGNNGSAAINNGTLLDLTTLDNFIFTNAAGNITLGSGNRSGADFRMAAVSNYVVAASFNANTGSSSSGANGTLTFGGGTNIINVNTFNISASRGSCTVNFPGTGGLRLRGAGGTDADRVNMTVGNHNVTGTGSTAAGTLSFNGHPVDLMLNTLTLGTSTAAPTGGSNPGNGTLSFDTGVVDATNILMAIANNVSFNNASGTINVAGGSLNVGAGGISLVNLSGAALAATGNLNISGGTVNSSGNIIKTTTAGVGNVTMTGGALTLASGKNIGSSSAPIDTFTMGSAALSLGVVNTQPVVFANALNLTDSANSLTVTALPSIGGFPSQFPIISFVSGPGAGSISLSGPLPGSFTGYLSNDVNTVWLVITNGPFVARNDSWGGAVNYNWDTSTLNWTNAGVATTFNNNDFVAFEDGARTNNVNLTGARAPGSLSVNNSVLNYTFLGAGSLSGASTLVKAGSASLTLTESGGDNFSGGIAVNGGTLILDNANSAISGGLSVVANATAQIGNNSANGALPAGTVSVDGTLAFSRSDDITVATAIGGAGSVVKKAAGKLTMTANNGFTGPTVVTAGTLALAGAGNISNSAQVSVTGAALDLSGKTVPTTLTVLKTTNANLTINAPNLQTPLNVTDLVPGGANNVINFSGLPPIASYPATITVIQAADPINGFNFVAGTFPAGSPSFAGTVSLSGDSLSVRLTLTAGPTGVRPQMFWTGADAPNTNWSDGLNWQLPGAPTSRDNVFFTGVGAVLASALSSPGGGSGALIPDNINNMVDANFSIASLTYTNLGGSYHNTRLANGRTLTMTNILTVGVLDTGSVTPQQEFVTISGSAATVNVNNPAANVQVWLGSPTFNSTANQATLDLSALDNFNATVSRLTVGASAINNAINRPSGVLYLARTNHITVGFQTTTMHAGTTTGNAAIDVADCNGNTGSQSSLWLGQDNTFNADTIGIGRQKSTGNIRFNTIYANTAPYPKLTLRGFTTSRVSDLSIGDGVGNTGGTGLNGNALLGGGTLDALVDVLNVGRASSGTTGAGNTIGTLEFDAGTINANTVNIGLQPVNNTGKVGTGTVNVNTNATIGDKGHLIVNGTLSLGTNVNSSTSAGTLNINGGFVQAGNIVAGLNGAISTINLVSGTLAVTGTAGAPGAPITALNLTDGILQLTADGNGPSLVATTITTSGITTVNIGSVVNISGHVTIPLISYTGANPFANLTLGSPLPGYTLTLVDNPGNSTIDLEITPPPLFFTPVQNGNQIIISGTNGTQGNNYYVLTTTNIELPVAQWSVIATNQFGPGGGFSFTNLITPSTPKRFYLLKLP